MKVVSWNVNGLRTLGNLQLQLDLLGADIICLQETKISRSQLDSETAKCNDFYSFFNYPVTKQGYAGVATYVKKKHCPYKVDLLADGSLDTYGEGRIVVTYHTKADEKPLVVVNVYVPCGYQSEDCTKYEKKVIFLENLKGFVSSLIDNNYDVIVAGDLNVKSHLIDSAEAYENRSNTNFVAEWYDSPDKIIFATILDKLLVDCFRHLYPYKRECYTCWNSGLNARVNNYGTRIDYILVSKSSVNLIKSCNILSDITGSDHCPLSAEIDFSDIVPSKDIPPECTVFYPEFRGTQGSLSCMMLKRKSDNKDNNELENKDQRSQSKCQNEFETVSKKQKVLKKQYTQTMLKFASKSDSCTGTKKQHIVKPTISKCDYSKYPWPSLPPRNGVSVKSLLTGLPKPPLCTGHQLKSSLKTVTKNGPNIGKRFYCCSLPIGPSTSTNSRCNFFQWLEKCEIE